MATVRDFTNEVRPTWCPGCGDYGIWNALKRAFAASGLAPHEIAVVTGIGCGSKMNDYIHVNGLCTLHGRTLAGATGFKLANHTMKVVCVHGDGDGYGMGGNHFLHAARRNIGLVDVIENNAVYGLTKGQYSPTSRSGFVTRTSPDGAFDSPVNPLGLAISQGATFVARGFSLEINQLAELVQMAMEHRGYALIDVLQPCVTFNRSMGYDWYRERVYDVADVGHDPADRAAALERAFEFPGSDRIPTGLIYRREDVPSYEEQVRTLSSGALVQQPIRTRAPHEYRKLLEELM